MRKQDSAMHEQFKQVTTAAVGPTGGADERPWFEELLLEILARPVIAGSAREAYLQKEREIGNVFGRLAVLEAWTLHKRLSIARSDDGLATAFERLVPERRTRLLTFLAEARRRAAMARVG